ncbi:hypothetical protein OKA05_18315 [Luteolibacter arcticus]|uniref:Uncharacterized protein n=1 Tax=Luteolibacter arcticus TaxID=1581411 RepID=A0ABT3GLY8_9BACT|nr:hypothetical protein [Luteolibacter arcticus]MCW1924526.1 hypothetical protein [Luteolibacter arcticus]
MKAIFWILAAAPSAAVGSDLWLSGPQEIEATGEVLAASDITVQGYRLSYTGEEGPWTVDLGVGWNEYSLDYQPVLFGTTERIDRGTLQADLAVTREFGKEWAGSLRFRAYDGFSDYRSIWISEFYRQFFGAFSGYRDPDPKGFSFGGMAVWNYLPGSGKAEFSLETGRDDIAPGWSFNPELGQPVADRETLDTTGGSLRVEQSLNGWLKTEAALTARQTSDRQPRFSIRHSWAATAGPVGFRLGGGYSEESPAFEAFYGTALIEWDFLPQWTASAGYRIYEDTGEIEASGFNAQAPALESSEIFVGLRWDRGDLAIGGGVGFLDADYEALSADNRFFGNLYRDREWWTFRLAGSYRF